MMLMIFFRELKDGLWGANALSKVYERTKESCSLFSKVSESIPGLLWTGLNLTHCGSRKNIFQKIEDSRKSHYLFSHIKINHVGWGNFTSCIIPTTARVKRH